jgi:hypothetical protein
MAIDGLRRLELWARLGYAARGFVYLLLGWIALSTGRALSADEAVAEVERLPAAPLLLAFLAAGLFGYALFKLYSAAIDLNHKGDDSKGRLVRLGSALGGLAYIALAWVALKLLLDKPQSSGGGEGAASEMAKASGGDALLLIAALVVIGVAIAQFMIAWKAKFMDEMSGSPSWVRPLGRLGYAARALVIAIIGWFLLKAALAGERVRDFGEALALLKGENDWLFLLVAAGLVAFGITSLMMARYRRIEDRDMVDDLEQGVEKAKASVKS